MSMSVYGVNKSQIPTLGVVMEDSVQVEISASANV